MLERDIGKQEVMDVIENGELIEDYPDDRPYPSCLMFGVVNKRPLHVVVADNAVESTTIVITVYPPDSHTFMTDFKTRRK